MDRREELQEQFSNDYIKSKNRKSLQKISVRFGKTRYGILIMQKLKVKNVLICYPKLPIKKSWEDEFKKMKWEPANITYTTYLSVKKHIDNYDLVILDEINEASENQLITIQELLPVNENILGMSGTYSEQTETMIYQYLNMIIDTEYSTEQGIADNIVSDYNVRVYNYSIDEEYKYKIETKYKSWYTTNRKELDYLTKKVKESNGISKKFAALNRMRWINTCYSAKKKLEDVLYNLRNERYIVYCATSNFLDSVCKNSYHSKNKSNDNLKLFIEKRINNLGLIEMASSGVTFPDLKHLVIVNINSSSEKFFQKAARSLLNDGGIATIHVIVSTESFQQNWLMSALGDIHPNKIKNV